MNKLLSLVLAGACGAASAQTPALNPMPDGSRDLYLGLGAVAAPRYDGARERRVAALPVLQFEWSNGVFVSGTTAGVHLSASPSREYGPLLALQPRRDAAGNAGGAGGVDTAGQPGLVVPPAAGAPRGNRLDGMDPIGARLLAGGFFNYYLSPHLRLTSSLLVGSGNERKGATWRIGVQRVAGATVSQQAVSLSAGLTVANRDDNQAFFGVSPAESQRSGLRPYQARAGLKDAWLGARWNRALAPAWLLTASVQATHLLGSAADSPLVERATGVTLSAALAYRF